MDWVIGVESFLRGYGIARCEVLEADWPEEEGLVHYALVIRPDTGEIVQVFRVCSGNWLISCYDEREEYHERTWAKAVRASQYSERGA